MTARRQLETLALGREADSGRRPLARRSRSTAHPYQTPKGHFTR